ncbi:expansin EXLX1 family cellulose-binding protein [Kitasatospora atroaurantiaca]|uniref:expansin EXLX1 family cellulose-binding protein n=1 Tax=Kitasatospora atroaurantiaca TaxID=285545 RepID=UPI0024825927|nr:expansin EXLX1 family cellulose-binding protein [Kitasatospora atroaurantiaca]
MLTAVAAVACLAVALVPGSGTDTGRPAGAAVAGTPAGDPTGSGSAEPATGAPTDSAQPSASASAAASASPSASASARPSASASASATSKSAAAPATGRIRPGVSYQGVATAYEAADGNGACLFGPSGDMMIAAMNTTDYETSRACGAYVLVKAANGASITVRIVNECPLPCAPGQLDLSQQAFAKLADLKVGRLSITWTLLSPASAPDTLSVRYKTGSSQYWCAIQVIGHRNPVAALEMRTASGWRRLSRTSYNYFLAADGNGCGASIRITDIYGEQLTVDGLAVKPEVAQPTRVQFARH